MFPSLIASSRLETDLNGCLGVNWFEGLQTGEKQDKGELGWCMWPIYSTVLPGYCHALFRGVLGYVVH